MYIIQFASPTHVTLRYMKFVCVLRNSPVGTSHRPSALRLSGDDADVMVTNLTNRGYLARKLTVIN